MGVVKGSINVSQYVVIRDSITGVPETGFDVTTLDLQYTRAGVAPVAKQDATALAATDSVHGDNQAIEIDATNSPGLCRVDFPDAAFASGVNSVTLSITGAGFDPIHKEIELVAAHGYDAGVWVDTNASNTNTVRGVDGIASNPVSTIAAARTIADALGLKKFNLMPGSSITLAQAYDAYIFDNYHATIALGGQSLNNAIFNGGVITGNDDGSNASPTQYCFCFMSGNTLGQFVFTDCYISGTITLAEAGTYRMHNCLSATAGPGSPNLDFGAGLTASDVNMRNYSGGIEIENMGAGAGTYNLSLEGYGQLIINANCSATSNVVLRGNFNFTDNAGGAVSVTFDDDTTDINTLLTQLGGIANVGSAVNIPADSYVLAVGTQSSGTFASTAALDGTNHEHTDVGNAMDLYYEFIIGSGIPTDVIVTGYLNGNNDDLEVYGYDWVAAAWVRIGTLEGKNASTNEVNSYIMFINMVGSGANEGIVRVRFTDGAFTLSGATLAIDQIFVSFSRGSEGYDNGAVWIDTGASNTNTVVGVDGTSRNPVSTIGAVNTLLALTNLHRVEVAPGSSITFAASQDNQVFHGENWTLALGGQSVSATHIIGATVTGICTGASKPTFEHCHFGAVTMPPCHFEGCTLEGTLTIGSAGTFSLARCQSGVPGSATPILDFGGALNSSEVGFRGFSGGIEIQNMGAGTGTYLMTLEGEGQLIINANCSATSSVELRGDFRLTDNAGGAVVVTRDDDSANIILTKAVTDNLPDAGALNDLATLAARLTAARAGYLDELAAANIPADVDTLLTRITAVIATKAEMDTAHALLATEAKQDIIDTVVDAILVDTALMDKWLNNRIAFTGTSMILYDDDGTTPLITWTLSQGSLTVSGPYDRAAGV